MTDRNDGKTLVQLLQENNISLDVIRNEQHPEFFAQKERLTYLIQSGQITEAISTEVSSANDGFRSVSGDAKESQTASIEALKSDHTNAFSVILRIVKDARSDALRREALSTVERMSENNNKTQKEVSSDNNRTFQYIAWFIFGGLVLVTGGAVAAKKL